MPVLKYGYIIRHALYYNYGINHDGSMTEPVIQLLKGKNFAHLSTLMNDGSPQVTPTWIDLDENSSSILIGTVEGRIKHKNVSRDPRVAISISDADNPYNMVLIRGR